jgi:transposase
MTLDAASSSAASCCTPCRTASIASATTASSPTATAPPSQDLRDRVLDACGTIREVAERFGVSPSYVSKAGARLRTSGQRTTKPRGGQRRPILAGREDLLRARIAEVPDATLAELQSWLRETHGIKVCIGALWNGLRRMALSLKKKRLRSRTGAIGRAGGARGVASGPART